MVINPTFQRGFVVADAIFGLVIITSTSLLFAATYGHERAAETSLAHSRAAVHLAEHALLNLQHNQPLPQIADDAHLSVRPAADGVAPTGFIWAKATATVSGKSGSLLGIVPASSLPPMGEK